jgi:FMN phosphatase YigB (HAD superfamily)
MHVLSNYPTWYLMIEERLGLSRYLPWSFVSCRTGVRKPDPEAFLGAARALALPPGACLFIDDHPANVEAARAVGMQALRFEGAASLRAELERERLLGSR